MTDKLYNGFREGRMPGDYKPNNQVREMTKEQSAVKWIAERFRQYQKEGYRSTWDEIIQTVLLAKQIEDQELAKERERSAKLVELLKEYEQWEADLIADNAMWWPSVPKDRISGKTYDTMLILQNKRNELLNQKNS